MTTPRGEGSAASTHAASCRRIPVSARPRSVSVYSTRGGASGNAARHTIPSSSSPPRRGSGSPHGEPPLEAVRAALESSRLTPEDAEALGHFTAYPDLRELFEPRPEEAARTERPRRHEIHPVATLVAKLCDIAPDGTSALVTRSLLNLAHHRSHAEPEPLAPGRAYDLELELDCTAWRFAAGHRIRLDLAAADWPTVWPAPHPAGLRVSRPSGRLELMTLAPPTGPAPHFGEPPPLPTLADVTVETPRQEAVLDQMAEEIRIRGRIGRELALPWGTTVREFREMESIMGCGESPTASSRGTGGVLLRRPDVTVEVQTALRVDASPSAFDVRLELDVKRDGKDFFHRAWGETIARRLL